MNKFAKSPPLNGKSAAAGSGSLDDTPLLSLAESGAKAGVVAKAKKAKTVGKAKSVAVNVSLQGGGGQLAVTQMGTVTRETWSSKIDFLLSVIGFAVDLANVWRFPYITFLHGGGAFFIPYLLMLLFAGIPLFYMELALGQYYRRGAVTTWGRVCPLFKGIGYCVIVIAFYTDFFYNVIIAYGLHFFFASFTSNLPWSSCENEWNSNLTCRPPFTWKELQGANASQCLPFKNTSVALRNQTDLFSAADEYFYKKVLGLRDINTSTIKVGVTNVGKIQWELALCLLAVYLICFFSMWKGIKMSGKVVWFTAIFPYVVLFVLLVRGVSLPGAVDGIKFYLYPNLSKLKNGQVWLDAATQVFFSLGPGFGVLLAFSSYNKFHNNVYQDAIITSTINCATSFLAGFVIFSVLGYMSCKSGKPIEEVAAQGPGLVFVVYPEALATLPGSTFFSLMFFMMLLTLGLDSSFGGSEAIITALSDEYPILARNRGFFIAGLFSIYMLVGLLMVSQAGLLFVEFLSHFAASWGLLVAVLFETVVISWIYGLDRFCGDIKEMMGFTPGFYFRVCWKYLGPAFLVYNIIYGFMSYNPLKVDHYEFPAWIEHVGFALSFSSAILIPIVGVYQLWKAPGATIREKFRSAITPWKETADAHEFLKKNVELAEQKESEKKDAEEGSKSADEGSKSSS